jgi:dTMP kinase
MLKEYLKNNNIDFYFTREPGGTGVSEQIRNIILDGKNSAMVDECEALLYAAARVQLIKEEIAPRLNAGQLVLCDRYVDSSFAYQAVARGLGYDFIENINCYATKNFMPDYTVWLDLTPEQAFKRKGGVDKNDRVELSGMEFHNNVYRGYKELSLKYPERFIVIDASGTKEQTQAKIISALKEKGII